MPEDRDHAVVAVGEVPTDRDDAEYEEGWDEREVRRQSVHDGVERSGLMRSLKKALMPSASVCNAERPGLVGPHPVLHAGDDLALEPDHQHGGDQQEDEADHDLQDRDEDHGRVDVPV